MTINKFVFEQLAFKDAFKFTTSGTPFYTTADFDQAIADAQAKLKLQVDAFKRIEKVYKDKNTLEGLPQSKKREKTGTLPFSITLNQKNGSQTLIYSKQREASPFNPADGKTLIDRAIYVEDATGGYWTRFGFASNDNFRLQSNWRAA